MEYSVRHRTTYRYRQTVAQSWHLAHLGLRATPGQRVHETAVILTPEPVRRIRRADWFGNPCEWFFFDAPHDVLEVTAESRVQVAAAPARAPEQSLTRAAVRALLENPPDAAARDAVQYIFDSPLSAFTADIAS